MTRKRVTSSWSRTKLGGMTAPDSAIRVSNLTKSFDGKINAVDGISFDLPKGHLVGLLGGNGAGKTTTISMLLGVLLPTIGDIHVLGTDMLTDRHSVLANINFSSPYVDMPYRLSIRECLTVFSHFYSVKNYKQRIAELVEQLEIANLLDRLYGSLSAGQKTRALLAKSLINSPQVLLLDEPTASLDPDTADWVRTFIKNYQKNTNATILMASHNMPEVERMCDNVLMMRSGKIVDSGTPAALIAKYGHEDMEQVFLSIARAKGTADV